jgi:urocanate hydratase
MRGATWVSLHNGGGTGWGMANNGGFGLGEYMHCCRAHVENFMMSFSSNSFFCSSGWN